jgi:signal transduction histidine kinase
MTPSFQNSLKKRLVTTGITLLVLVLLASAALLYTARQYNFYLERSARAQHVYASYRAVSDHTYRKLNAIGEIVESGTLTNLQERYRNKEALRASLRDVRESIAAELTLVGDVKEAEELEHFNKIELLAEEIIRSSKLVRNEVANSNETNAKAALGNLRSHKVEGTFIRLIDEALAEELREVRETQLVAQELNTVITRLLSLLFVCFIVFGAYLLFTTWRALTRSVSAFEQAAIAYQSGDFTYRVPNDVEQEFSGLGSALNKMASEVESQRHRAKTTQETLESIIDNRTSELKKTNEKLALVSETRKQFLADISHELRTPLTIMQGEADIALRGETKKAEQYIDALSRIKEQTTHTTRFVQDLLFVARAEDGKAPVHKRPVALVPLVADVCDDFAAIAKEKNIEILQHYPKHDMVASIDASRIRQVVTILLDNAIRYSYSESVVEVNVQDLNQLFSLEIKDSGIGLKYNESSQVFSRFYRGNEGSGKASGTGLGLPVAKAIIDAHGGSINLHGESGEGTTATVTLPLEAKLRAVK